MLFFLPLMVSGQDNLEKLKAEQEQLAREINFTKQKISEIRKKKTSSLTELETLNKQIEVRKAMIANINAQVRAINRQIAETATVIQTMQEDLEKMKESYAALVYQAYVNQNSYNRLLFVFASDDFNDALKRITYLKRFSEFRKEQAELISKTQESLQRKIALLQQKRDEKSQLLNAEWEQKKELGMEQRELRQKVNCYQSEEARYLAEVRKKEAAAAQLNQQIARLIAEANKKNSGSASTFSLTPEARALSSEFVSNKGKLPWPVERGTIIRGFGKKLHPVLRDPPVYENNNGIDISTTRHAPVRAVFQGTVATVFYSPVFHNGIIINHGEYYTVYTMLDEVYVKEGDKVSTKQQIGRAWFNEQENSSEVHLEIWKGQTLMNPALWIYR